jgi:hypothetical protein
MDGLHEGVRFVCATGHGPSGGDQEQRQCLCRDGDGPGHTSTFWIGQRHAEVVDRVDADDRDMYDAVDLSCLAVPAEH